MIVLGDGQGAFGTGLHRERRARNTGGAKTGVVRARRRSGGAGRARRQQEARGPTATCGQRRWHWRVAPSRRSWLIAERAASCRGRRCCSGCCSRTFRPDDLFLDVFGKPDRIAAKHYPQALAVALACGTPWRRDLLTFSKRLGVKVTSKDLADTPAIITRRWRGAQRADQTAEDADAQALRPSNCTPLTDSSVGGARGSHRLVQTTSRAITPWIVGLALAVVKARRCAPTRSWAAAV